MFQEVAELIECRQFATAFVTGIQGQNPMIVHRRMQEQIAQILGEDAHRVGFSPIGQFAACFALQAGEDQTREGIAGAAAEIIGMRMVGRNE